MLLFCIAYVLPGYLGRVPWKSADMTAFGYMAELAGGAGHWFSPKLMGMAPEVDALLPYWLGAWAMQLAPAWIAPDFAARIPFGLMLALAMAATWYGTYYLARSPQAQPVAFAFGGEARPADYARAMADGGLLAFIACLGLAQLAHETTPALAQLCFTALFFYALAVLPYRTVAATIAGSAGLIGLACQALRPWPAVLGFGGALIHLLDRTEGREHRPRQTRRRLPSLHSWRRVLPLHWSPIWDCGGGESTCPKPLGTSGTVFGRLFLWFTWPAWPLGPVDLVALAPTARPKRRAQPPPLDAFAVCSHRHRRHPDHSIGRPVPAFGLACDGGTRGICTAHTSPKRGGLGRLVYPALFLRLCFDHLDCVDFHANRVSPPTSRQRDTSGAWL